MAPDADQCPPCRRRGTRIDLSRAAGLYDGALRRIVHALKYDGRQSLAGPLATRMRDTGAIVLDGAAIEAVGLGLLRPGGRAARGTLTDPGKNSPYRDRGIEENLALFRRMRAGEFPNGTRVLRAKIDMA